MLYVVFNDVFALFETKPKVCHCGELEKTIILWQMYPAINCIN